MKRPPALRDTRIQPCIPTSSPASCALKATGCHTASLVRNQQSSPKIHPLAADSTLASNYFNLARQAALSGRT